MPFILTHLIIIALFYVKNLYKKIEEDIKNISFGTKNWNLVIKEKKERKKGTRKIKKDEKKKRKT